MRADCRRSTASLPRACCAGLALMAGLATPPAQAVAVWQETNHLSSTLDNNASYTTNGNTGIVNYLNQTATNTGATAQHMGMYFGWNWVTTYSGQDIAMPWSNANGVFQGGPVALTIERPGVAALTLRIGDVQGDSWIGVPWAPGAEPPIATAADWIVPMFDFGVIDAGASVLYDIRLSFEFATAADLADFRYFQTYAQGVQVVPEPTSLWLVVLGALCLLLSRGRAQVALALPGAQAGARASA
ncbi:PEP-CTERM sorting domain-containing protein [Aquabacterium sp.]|uniref:PEP-CTERM sorting domain-containing protein n=1 Tax=Aquabacterium sp. TaxID=1872578 RepID=UPI002BACBC11|nr:PEP-CTERM sorting domain-containing protein [Aquabacterium sp.]HSW07642.1 PEP-CTERM sorting domain-containing protein [Aquabacterium sp.]